MDITPERLVSVSMNRPVHAGDCYLATSDGKNMLLRIISIEAAGFRHDCMIGGYTETGEIASRNIIEGWLVQHNATLIDPTKFQAIWSIDWIGDGIF